jgi:two-component system NtrC family sensor kinase
MRVTVIRNSLRTRLLFYFIIVIAGVGILSMLAGIHFIQDRIVRQAQNKVIQDLNSARLIYQARLKEVENLIRLSADRFFIKESFLENQTSVLRHEFDRILTHENLDFLTLADDRGRVIYRAGQPSIQGGRPVGPKILEALLNRRVMAYTEVFSAADLLAENPELRDRVMIRTLPTPHAKFQRSAILDSGLVILATAPVFDNQANLLGFLYGGILLNQSDELVDRIKETVYQEETYRGREIGSATIFLWDVRIATNVKKQDGSRAIGTRVSTEVYDQVLVRGNRWLERAFVVNDWYITAYEPIRNGSGNIIGMIYVGLQEQKFTDMKKQSFLLFAVISALGILTAVAVALILSASLLKPLNQLVQASDKVARGDLDNLILGKRTDEIGILTDRFNQMTRSLSEKENMREIFITMVSHELKSPLAAIQYNMNVIIEGMMGQIPDLLREKLLRLETRIGQLIRLINDWLRLSHLESQQVLASMTWIDVNHLIQSVIDSHDPIAQKNQVHLEFQDFGQTLAMRGREDALQAVFANLISNAIKYNRPGGKVIVSLQKENDSICMKISDTGIGIPEDKRSLIFKPFFRVQEKSVEGSGLGLALVKKLVELHNGTIQVHSAEGGGSVFQLCFPLNRFKTEDL